VIGVKDRAEYTMVFKTWGSRKFHMIIFLACDRFQLDRRGMIPDSNTTSYECNIFSLKSVSGLNIRKACIFRG
jgi:hypothetical protein